jgi:hypothetical protein
MYLFMSQSSVGRGRGALYQRTSISSIPLCRLGDGGIMGTLAAWAEAGADDAMLARREKAIFGFCAEEAQKELDSLRRKMNNTKQALERAKARAEAAICGAASSRTADEWLQLSREAEKKAQARERERLWLRTVLANHGWRPSDMAAVLAELMEGRFIESLMDTPIFQKVFIARVNELMKLLEGEHFGIQFGMFLHFEMRVTMPNILRLTQAASKTYNRDEMRVTMPNILRLTSGGEQDLQSRARPVRVLRCSTSTASRATPVGVFSYLALPPLAASSRR